MVTRETSPALDRLVQYAVRYYHDFVKPTKRFRAPSEQERAAMADLAARFRALPAGTTDGETIQNEVYEVGKAHFGKEALRDWFKALYETLLGSSQGPRMGSFIALYGVENSRRLIGEALREG